MTLLYLAAAYLVGIFLGRLATDAGWIGCAFPDWLWGVTLVALCLTPFLQRLPGFTSKPVAMRWPVSAGFDVPRPSLSPVLLIAMFLCVLTGALRYASYPIPSPFQLCWTAADLAYYNQPASNANAKGGAPVTVIGHVTSYPLVKDTRQRMQVQVNQIEQDGTLRPVQGVLALSTGIRQRYHYGQVVRLRGQLTTPPDFEDFSYREYLARKGVHSLLARAKIEPVAAPDQGNWLLAYLYQVRARGETLLNRLLPEPYAALANGMLLGIEAGIPDALYEQFNLTGSSHVIVISGSNVALISGVLLGFGQRLLGRRRSLWPTLLGIACYALLVGGDAAVLRAGVMGTLYVIATVLNRRSTALVSLATACAVITLFNPLTLWDVGFQLSSAATAGLILFSPPLVAALQRLWPPPLTEPLALTAASVSANVSGFGRGLVEDGLLTTLAANATTLPLTLYYFGRLSVVSLLTNLVIIPVQPLVMLSGSAGLLIGLLGLPLLAQVILWVTWLGLVWTVAVVQQTARLPGGSLEIASYGLGALTFTYAVIFAWRWHKTLLSWLQALIGGQLRQWRGRLVGPVAVSCVGVTALLAWSATLAQPDLRLHVHFLDIGQGDGILIETPSGRQVLIDGGAEPQRLFNQLGQVMPFWDRDLDLLVLTNPDKDHMDAQLEVPPRLQVGMAIETQASQLNHDADGWRARLADAEVPVHLHHQGGWFDLGDGVALWVLWPPTEPFGLAEAANEQFFDNENSLVMKLVYGNFSVLLTGDTGEPAEEMLVKSAAPLTATVLKVGHHGSKGSSSAAFIAAVNPQVAVIQSGKDNDYGHPHAEALDRLSGRMILRNDLQGRIHIYSDGKQMWVETEQNNPLPSALLSGGQ